MLREVFILSLLLLYTETILQVYVLIQPTIPFAVFISSVCLLAATFLISNAVSLVWIFRGDQKPSINKPICVIFHILLLGPIWRIIQIYKTGYNIEREIIIVRFFHCGIQTIPFLLIHGAVDLQALFYKSGGIIITITLLISSLSLALSFSSFSFKYSLVNCDHPGTQRLPKRFFGSSLVCFGTFLMLATRFTTIMFMAAVVTYWAALPVGCHFVIILSTYMTCTRDLTWKVKKCSPWNWCRYSVFSYFHVFEMMEFNFRVIQCKYVAFYAIILVENIVMSAVWLLYSNKDYLTKLVTVVFLLFCYVSALIAKYSGCYLLTKPEETPEKLSVTKSSVQLSKSDPIYAKSKIFKKEGSSFHHTASAESHTTETIISRGTSGATQKTDLDYESFYNRARFKNHTSSINSKCDYKIQKNFKKKMLFRHNSSLFHFPVSSTHRSCSSIPGTVFVSSLNDSDKCEARANQRVRGRRGFKLGQPRPTRPYTIHGGIFLDDSYLNSRTHLRNPNLHTKIQRTQSMFVDDTSRPEVPHKLNVTKLPHHTAWYNNSFTDSCSLYSEDNDKYYNDEDISTSRTSSNTKLTLSSGDLEMWNNGFRPSFENLDRLPTKTIETEKRIKSWLSETVNIFDLLHEKTHDDHWTIRRKDGKSVRLNKPIGFELEKPTLNQSHANVTQTNRSRNTDNRHDFKFENNGDKERRKSTGSRLHGHKNSLREIDKLKQFIQSTDQINDLSKPPDSNQLLDLQKYRLGDRLEKPEKRNNFVKQSTSFPLNPDFQERTCQPQYDGYQQHKHLVSVESLV